jgi:hypothetical protein
MGDLTEEEYWKEHEGLILSDVSVDILDDSEVTTLDDGIKALEEAIDGYENEIEQRLCEMEDAMRYGLENPLGGVDTSYICENAFLDLEFFEEILEDVRNDLEELRGCY